MGETTIIRLLPPEVRSRLRSGITTPSIAQCVEELVLNSVDAEATCIAVRVDIPNCRIQVVDNGRGLSREDFELVGRRYATSKCHHLADLDHLDYFGYRGEALASISHVSRVLEIVSKAKGSEVTLSKLFRNGKSSEVFEATRKRPSVGTTITVHSVFYNMPVRRKIISVSLDYERVCQRIEGLALIHPGVSFSLRDDSTGTKSIQTRITSSLINTFRFLFGQVKAKSLKEVTNQLGKFSISGYMGVEGHPNKNLQFVYVNNRLVLKTRLHKAVNYLLRKSLIAHYRPRFGDRESATESTAMPVMDLTNSPGKAGDQYGIFVLNVKCPLSEYDICLEPSKSLVEFREWSGLLHCIEQLVSHFLAQENLTMKVDKEKRDNSHGDQCAILMLDDGSSQEDDDDEGTEDQEMTAWSCGISSLSQKYGRGINASACSNTLRSVTVRRPLHKLSSESVSQSSESDEKSETPESVVKAVLTRSAMLSEDNIAPKVNKISPCGSENSGTEGHSERQEIANIEKTVYPNVQQPSTDMEEISLRSNLQDDLTSTNILSSTITACGRYQHRGSDGQLEQSNSQSPTTNCSLIESVQEVRLQNPTSCSPRITVSPGPSDNEQAVDITLDSEETAEAVSVIFSSSENEERLLNPSSCLSEVLPRLEGHDSHDSRCQPCPESPVQTCSSRLDRETSCKKGSRCSPPDVVNDGHASKVPKEFFDKETIAISQLGKNEIANLSLIPRNENGPFSLAQQKQVYVKTKDTSQESHSDSSSTDLELGKNEESEDQFLTPKTRNTDIFRNCNARHLRKHETSSASSVSSFGTSNFDLESETETSDSCVLIKQDEIHVSSKSANTASPKIVGKESPKNPHEACHVITEVKPQHRFISLVPSVDDPQRNKNVAARASSPCTYLDGSTSSLQIFKKSIQAKSLSSISELLHGKDEQATSRFFPQNSGARAQSARFTTASPVVLKRRFTPGLMMLDMDRTDEMPTNPQMSAQTSGATNTDANDHRVSVPVTPTENLKLETVGTGKTTLLSVSVDKPKRDDHKTNRCPSGPLESPWVVKSNKAKNLSLDSHLISRKQVNRVQEEKDRNDAKHTSSAARPNLKRLRQMPQTTNSSDAKVLTFKGQMKLILNKGAEEKEAPPTKRFMTSDGFLQTIPHLQPDVVIAAKETPADLKKPQAVSCSLTDHSSLPADKHEDHKHQDKIADPYIFHSKDSKSAVKLREKGTDVSSMRELVDIKKPDDSGMHIQKKDLTSEESILKRTDDLQQQVHECGGCSDNHGKRKTVSYPAEIIPPCPPHSEDPASENTLCSYSSQKISESRLAPSRDNLPVSVVLCNTNNFKLREKELSSGSVDSDLQCVLSPSESATYPVDVCCELSKSGSFTYTSHVDSDMSLTSRIEMTAPAYSSTCATAVKPGIELSEAWELEVPVGLAPDGHENAQAQPQNEGERNADITAETHPRESQCTYFVDEEIDNSGSLLVENQQDEQEKQQPSCPTLLTDICGKSWSCHYDAKLGRQVYVDLNTGNCSLETPVFEKVKSTGDGMTEETADDETGTCALIIPTGRKKSHLHLLHSLCAEPFLTVSPGMMTGPHARDASCSNLSPSSHSALIHMVDDHIDQQGGELASKWRGERPNKQAGDSCTMDQLFADWTNPMFASLESDIMDAQASHMPRSSIRAQNTVHPYRFTKEMFRDIKVLGQVDNKFIACMVSTEEGRKVSEPNLLMLIDQHAAHERVRLEQLTSDVFEDPRSDDGDEGCTVEQSSMKSSSIIPPVELTMPRKERRLLNSFGNKLERLGVSYRIVAEDEDHETEEGRVEITRLPACLVEREAAELKRGRQPVAVSMVQALLAEHLEVLQKTSGASAILPKTITRVLNSQACHGAIKFGDQLSHRECLSLIGQLSHCDLPFQCAHGRPSLVPLFDFKLLATKLHNEVDDYKPRLSRLQHSSR